VYFNPLIFPFCILKENLFLVRDTEKQDISSLYYNGACVIPIGCIRSVEKLSN